jgi:ribosomal protein L1
MFCKDGVMPRRAANTAQADIARAIRAAKQAGAECVEVRRDGTIVVLIKAPSIAPSDEGASEGQLPWYPEDAAQDL